MRGRLSVRQRRALAATVAAVALFGFLAGTKLSARRQESWAEEDSDEVDGDDLRTSLEKAKHRAPRQIDLLSLSQAQLAGHMRYWEQSQNISRESPSQPSQQAARSSYTPLILVPHVKYIENAETWWHCNLLSPILSL